MGTDCTYCGQENIARHTIEVDLYGKVVTVPCPIYPEAYDLAMTEAENRLKPA